MTVASAIITGHLNDQNDQRIIKRIIECRIGNQPPPVHGRRKPPWVDARVLERQHE